MRRLITSPFLSGLLLAGSLFASHAEAGPLPVTEVAPGVYVHQGEHKDFDDNYNGDIANIGFVVGTDAVAVVDTGGSYQIGLALKDAVRKVTKLPIRFVINTHVHPDHVFGNAAFTVDHPIFIGHVKLPAAMQLRQNSYLRNLQAQLGAGAEKSTLIAPGKMVEKSYQINLGGRVLELTAWPPSHSDTDLTVFDATTKTLWTGDLLFIQRTPSIDGDIKGWLDVIDALANIPAGITVPGHGPVTNNKGKALNDERRYLVTLLQDVRASIKNDVDMVHAMDSAAKNEKNRWLLFEVVNRRNVNRIYPVLEWE
jgi:quinoprotein relay system zinc metallohydrolase 2